MLPPALDRLIERLARLPGVGEKTATRYALYLVTADPAYVAELGDELRTLPERVRPCSRCGFLADVAAGASAGGAVLCRICRDPHRDPSVLCVVARVQDLIAFERSGAMRGRYFVLQKLLSPLDGVGPEDLPLDELARRMREDGVREVVVATPPTVDGEATALLLGRELRGLGVKVSRIASGVPHGGDLEFADQITLGRALEGRRPIE
ncbi:MAG TPA: recombination mediator RecR [Polyangiaceae bacterium]|nr:recombination mediator RecR [Polyangiaceae bacterium]